MRRLIPILAGSLLLISAIAFAQRGAGVARGYLNYLQQQQVRDCIQACGQDGRCQAACISAGNNQSSESPGPRQRVPVTDYTCVEASMKGGLTWGNAMQVCTH